MSAESGQVLSHYRLLEKIGQGAMGVVYRALDTHLQRQVAIKVLRPQKLPDKEDRKRFRNEAVVDRNDDAAGNQGRTGCQAPQRGAG